MPVNSSEERKTKIQEEKIRPFTVGVILIGVEEVDGLVIVLTFSQN